jgi:hypothetical protein
VVSMLISPFSAISSWEGYEYQGHIALFVALRKIKELIIVNKELIHHFILEIEGAEDFSIKEDDKYITLHQVKSGTIDLDQDEKKDKFSFIISLLQYNAEYGYFHILPKKSIPNDFIKKTIAWIDQLLIDFSKEVKYKDEEEVLEAGCDKYIIINNILPTTKKGSLYNILNFVSKGKKVKEEVQNSIEDIKTKLLVYRNKLIENEVVLEDSNLMSKYDQDFNNSQEVKKASYLIIKDILLNVQPGWKSFINEDYLEFVYGQILLKLKNRITNNIQNKTEDDKNCRIKFSSIFNVLTYDYHTRANSINYQYFLLWKSIQNIEEFPIKNTDICKVDSCENCIDTNCNLIKQIKMISEIEEENFTSFLYRLILREPEEGKPNNMPTDNLINRLFMRLLKEIELLSLEKNNIIQAQKNGLFYRLSLDSSGEVHELQEQLDKEMHNSNGDKLLIYESDILITDQLNVENFIYNGINTTIIGEKELKEIEGITSDSIEKTKKNYNKPKVMKLIDRRTAKKELCE